MTFAAQIAATPCSAVLMSGGAVESGLENRYSMAAWDPFVVLSSKRKSCKICDSKGTIKLEGDPLQILDDLCAAFEPDFPLFVPPFSGGVVGYFAYDLKNVIEKLPATAVDDLNLPDIFVFWPKQVLIFDRVLTKLVHLSFKYENDSISLLADLKRGGKDRHPVSVEEGIGVSVLGAPEVLSVKAMKSTAFTVGNLQSNFTHEDYLRAVRRVRQYIQEGDVYQVNLSQRYQLSFMGDPFQLWSSLFELNPTPFYAFINADDHQVLSTSMERFLCRRGEYIETRPIKGTRKRGSTPAEDKLLRDELRRSPKDDAELSMIVDLLRNDLGRVCRGRTIRVSEHKRLESYQSVHHLVSIVTGQLNANVTYGELLRATFPGGSITGCPKIRSMEIIDEMEPHVRHIYTGSIGYLGWHENMDLNIAIRTALIKDAICYFSVGGGIVYDSNEEDEYQETLHKGRSLFQVIENIGKDNP